MPQDDFDLVTTVRPRNVTSGFDATSASEQSVRAAQQVAHLGERVAGEEDAERLLLHREQLDALELVGRQRRVVRRRGRCAAAPAGSRSKIEPWPDSASSCAFAPEACACGSTDSIPLRVAPVESSAPHLIRLSIAFLLTVRQSTRAQKSQIEVKAPPAARASRIFSTAA